MKQKHIFPLLISFALFLPSVLMAQSNVEADTLEYREKYGLRLGVDLSKPLRTLLDDDYQGFELKGDYRLYKDYYLAGELGNEKNLISETNVTAEAKGSYIKLGVNYNAYDNWAGMENLIFAGLRFGFASFSSELQEYSIYTTNSYFPPDIRNEAQEFSNLTASWIELQLGIKVEVLNNVFLGTHVQLKRRITQTTPQNFDNLYIPGFNRTFDDSSFGAGVGYSISYLIPFYKK
ncbi:DUF6048 family protein [Salinimicrobium flavum]|uniref:DUF6048 family protein n=1 Tax=Salinimicrobium flavum TaxID=1737065 RepID=A0ABW5J1Q5_9FLAO